jgi:hypothetical protein
MKSMKTVLAALAVVALAGSAVATQTQTIWVSDSGGGISLTPATSTSGSVSYTGSDAFWSIVLLSGTAYPPTTGQGSLADPVLDLSVTATSVGSANASLHPLVVTFGADGFGPTSGSFAAQLSGHVVTGSAHPLLFNTYSAASPISGLSTPPAGTLLTTSGSLAGPTYDSGPISSGSESLGSPYALEEVITIQADANGASYSLDGGLSGVSTVPDGGTTAMLLGAALSVLGLIRRKLA